MLSGVSVFVRIHTITLERLNVEACFMHAISFWYLGHVQSWRSSDHMQGYDNGLSMTSYDDTVVLLQT